MQDKIANYLEETLEPQNNLEIEPLESQFKTNLLTTSKVKDQTRKNIRELEKITGNKFNITI